MTLALATASASLKIRVQFREISIKQVSRATSALLTFPGKKKSRKKKGATRVAAKTNGKHGDLQQLVEVARGKTGFFRFFAPPG